MSETEILYSPGIVRFNWQFNLSVFNPTSSAASYSITFEPVHNAAKAPDDIVGASSLPGERQTWPFGTAEVKYEAWVFVIVEKFLDPRPQDPGLILSGEIWNAHQTWHQYGAFHRINSGDFSRLARPAAADKKE